MRVLYVIDSLAPGGAERSLVAMAPLLVDAGVGLEVVAVHDGPGMAEDLRRRGIPVHYLAPGGRAARARELARLVRWARPDLVHTTLFEADIAGRLAAAAARVPSVTTLANESYGPVHALQPGVGAARLRAAQAADAATARLSRRFHAVSEVVASTMARRLLLPRRRIDVVHRGRDPAVLGRRSPERAARVRADLGLGGGAPLVVAVARHEYDKGLDVALAALPEIRRAAPGAVLAVAGREGNQTEQLRRLVPRAAPAPSVLLLGPRDDVADLLAAADVFVAPSRREGLPGAVLEAMALEAPVVASDLPTVREAVGPGGECAVLVPADDAAALAAAVGLVLADTESTGGRVQRGRRRFEELFTIDRAAAGMVAFYQRALGG